MPGPKHRPDLKEFPVTHVYKPYSIPVRSYESVILLQEEYETIHLLDQEEMSPEVVAQRMNISVPTLIRIYEQARKTVADACKDGKRIVIEGGHVRLGKYWFRCRRCYKLVEGLDNHDDCKDCNCFSLDELQPLN